jgi:hypothetical protein
MVQKIKDFFSGLWGWIVLILAGTLGILAYALSQRKKEVNTLQAKIDLVETQKHADLLEVEIKERMKHSEATSHEIADLKTIHDDLEVKREQLPQQEQNKSDKDIEDFWNKK